LDNLSNNLKKYHSVFKIFNDHRHDFLCLITEQDLLHHFMYSFATYQQHLFDSEDFRTCVKDFALSLIFIGILILPDFGGKTATFGSILGQSSVQTVQTRFR